MGSDKKYILVSVYDKLTGFSVSLPPQSEILIATSGKNECLTICLYNAVHQTCYCITSIFWSNQNFGWLHKNGIWLHQNLLFQLSFCDHKCKFRKLLIFDAKKQKVEAKFKNALF